MLPGVGAEFSWTTAARAVSHGAHPRRRRATWPRCPFAPQANSRTDTAATSPRRRVECPAAPANPWRRSPVSSVSSGHLVQHFVDHFAMFVLRTEQDDFGVFSHLHRMAGRPIEQVAAANHFVSPIRVAHGQLALDHIAPVWRLAHVTLQALQQRRDIRTGAQRKIFGTHHPESRRAAKFGLLPRHGAGYVDPHWYILLCNSHDDLLVVGRKTRLSSRTRISAAWRQCHRSCSRCRGRLPRGGYCAPWCRPSPPTMCPWPSGP